MSLGEQERMCRGYVRQSLSQLGPELDVPAPDVMSNAQHMLWMMDEYETMTGAKYPGVITGKPVGMGGSVGRTEATGYGGVYVLRDLLEVENIDIKTTTASIQGFGNAGEYFAKLYTEYGGTVICVSNSEHTYRKKTGCDIPELLGTRDAHGRIDKEKATALGYELLPSDAWIAEDVDILVPAAIENQVTPEVFPNISKQVKILCEIANGPTTPDCDSLIQERGLIVLPDFLTNAGGVTVSYFEQVQNNMNYYWSLDEVLEKLNFNIGKAFRAVYNLSKDQNLYMRDAAYIIAINRVADAVKRRGWI
jgi:glutamate dehydrogenase (NAD(P)+)